MQHFCDTWAWSCIRYGAPCIICMYQKGVCVHDRLNLLQLTCAASTTRNNWQEMRTDEAIGSLYRLMWCRLLTILISLHWLFEYYEALHWGAPCYLNSIIRVTDLPGWRTLHSVGSNSLLVPPFNLSTSLPCRCCASVEQATWQCYVGQITVNLSEATEVTAVICRHYSVTLSDCNTHSDPSSGLATKATLNITDWSIDWLILASRFKSSHNQK